MAKARYPLYGVIAGWALGMIALFIGDGEDVPAVLVLLLPGGLLMALGGLLLARDYGGSVKWMIRVFGTDRLWEPVLDGGWQVRIVGGAMVVIGLAWAVGGVFALGDL